jgi:hypothetical protein
MGSPFSSIFAQRSLGYVEPKYADPQARKNRLCKASSALGDSSEKHASCNFPTVFQSHGMPLRENMKLTLLKQMIE